MDQVVEKTPPAKAEDLAAEMLRHRKDFPILSTMVRGKPLIYLDNGATTQKPLAVIETINRFYRAHNSNVHRGVYSLSQEATDAYEWARRRVAKFLNAREKEIIFTRGTTESINLVAASWGRANIAPGDEIILSAMEHHSNIVPWQLLAESVGAVIRVIPMNDAGELDLDAYEKLLSDRTKFVAVVHVSNSLGTINDVRRIIQSAHDVGAKVLVDGAQWVGHHPTDVHTLDCDFYSFSGHKLYGPTGIGVLYGKYELLEKMPPYQGGGDMIESVSFAQTRYASPPARFEAGTPNISAAIGLASAIDYITSVGLDKIGAWENELLAYATDKLSQVPGLRILGTAKSKGAVISFVLENPAVPMLQIGMELDHDGIAVRTGHHCCQPVMDRLAVPGTTRASLAFYNTRQEIDALSQSLCHIVEKARASAGTLAKTAPAPAATSTTPTPNPAEIAYPQPTADSVTAAGDLLAADFELLEDREAKNEYVLDLGAKLPSHFAILKKVTPRVVGCMSEVYVLCRQKPGTADVLELIADADAPIVRGLIALMEKLFSGQRAREILNYDVESFFRQIGLDEFISSQRRNGLAGMLQKIRTAAASIAEK